MQRRLFLKNAFTFLSVNAGLYIVGSAFQDLDGSYYAAGAKCYCECAWVNTYCGYSGPDNYGGYCDVQNCGYSTCNGNQLMLCNVPYP